MSAEAAPAGAGRVTADQVRLMTLAAGTMPMEEGDFLATPRGIAGVEVPEDVAPELFDRIMDRYVGHGFRHPAVPLVTAAQLAALDEARRRLGLGGRAFVRLVRQVGRARGRRHLDGIGFMALWKHLNDRGAGVPIPHPGAMTREAVGLLHLARHWTGMPLDEFAAMRMHFGGVPRIGMLDARAYLRMLYRFASLGVRLPEPPPLVPRAPGMVTQPQANLIWRLWCDFDGWKGDVSPAALDAAIGGMLGLGGGLDTLTRAGAAAVIDRFMVPKVNSRRAAEGAGEGQ